MSWQFDPTVKKFSPPLMDVVYVTPTHPCGKYTCAQWLSTSFWTKLSLFKCIDFWSNKHNSYVEMNFPSKFFSQKYIYLVTNWSLTNITNWQTSMQKHIFSSCITFWSSSCCATLVVSLLVVFSQVTTRRKRNWR